MPLEILSPSDQVAIHLRNLLLKGRWTGELPGTPALATELDVDRKTIMAALQILEKEGLLKSQGPGRPRSISPATPQPKTHLNVRIIPYDDSTRQHPLILELINLIEETGHQVSLTPTSLTDLGMDVKKVSRLVESHEADAWILASATREILLWFASHQRPAFSLFGRRRRVEIASTGPDKVNAIRNAVAKLVQLGHRRIVYLVHEERRIPSPGHMEMEFLKSLEAHGITPGEYHLPHWHDTPEGFRECLDRLFQHTPPTALIIDLPQLYFAAQQHLSQNNLIIPRDVSMICCDAHPFFEWCHPTIAHIAWDAQPVINQVVYWVNQVSRGKNDRKPTFTHAEFIEGGTIGPVA